MDHRCAKDHTRGPPIWELFDPEVEIGSNKPKEMERREKRGNHKNGKRNTP